MTSEAANLHSIADRVARGAALLDGREPGWADRVDPDRLDVGLRTRCVLGQVYGNYGLGRHFLELSGAAARRCGFRSVADRDEDAELTAAWAGADGEVDR